MNIHNTYILRNIHIHTYLSTDHSVFPLLNIWSRQTCIYQHDFVLDNFIVIHFLQRQINCTKIVNNLGTSSSLTPALISKSRLLTCLSYRHHFASSYGLGISLLLRTNKFFHDIRIFLAVEWILHMPFPLCHHIPTQSSWKETSRPWAAPPVSITSSRYTGILSRSI